MLETIVIALEIIFAICAVDFVGSFIAAAVGGHDHD
jgi:hypothetical protein